MAKKMTKTQKFEMLAKLTEVKNNPVLSEFVAHEIELLEKKRAEDKKPTAQQTANKAVADAILAAFEAEPNRLYTITDMIKYIPACAELTNQRVSAIIRPMIDVSIVRVEEKRRAYFKLLV